MDLRPRDERYWRQHEEPALTQEQILERVHSNLYELIGKEAERVAHLEKQWSASELTKRVVRYIWSGLKDPDLMRQPWGQVAKQVVEKGMSTYGSACQERPWFFELDLRPALASAVWELLSANGRPHVRYEEVEARVIQEVDENLDSVMLGKAIWAATEQIFPEDPVKSKVFRALANTHEPALAECLGDSRPLESTEKVKRFFKRWMEESMTRAWNSVEQNGGGNLSFRKVTKLFQNLIAPFGEEHNFTCIPRVLLGRLAPPRRSWRFIEDAAKQMFHSWEQAQGLPPSKRRKKSGGGTAEAEAPEEFEAFEAPLSAAVSDDLDGVQEMPELDGEADFGQEEPLDPEAEELAEEALDAEPEAEEVPEASAGGRHPGCTCAEDCSGSSLDVLVRHVHEDGSLGDVYCHTCWSAFLEERPDLQGQWEEGDLAGEPYG